MRLLLDTHVVLWWRQNLPIAPGAADAIAGADVSYVSLASAWEVAIEVGAGRLRLPATFEEGVRASGFTALPITFAHTEAYARLPRHHGDPFDRMLVAQALTDRLTLVTRDRALAPYGVQIVWA
jgi:PIN domain nuclease of toxin-antitoxin system